jgi:hypothetical protein
MLANCRIHSAKIELFGLEPNYRIELSELIHITKREFKYISWLNTSKSQVNRYLENVLYRVVAGNLKIQNNQIAYINSDELVFEVVMVGNSCCWWWLLGSVPTVDLFSSWNLPPCQNEGNSISGFFSGEHGPGPPRTLVLLWKWRLLCHLHICSVYQSLVNMRV